MTGFWLNARDVQIKKDQDLRPRPPKYGNLS